MLFTAEKLLHDDAYKLIIVKQFLIKKGVVQISHFILILLDFMLFPKMKNFMKSTFSRCQGYSEECDECVLNNIRSFKVLRLSKMYQAY